MIVLKADVLAAALDPKGADGEAMHIEPDDADTVRAMVDAMFLGCESLPFEIVTRMYANALLMTRGMALALATAEECGPDVPE